MSDSAPEPNAPDGSDDAAAAPAAPLPADAAGWRVFFGTVPPRDLWRVLLKEKQAFARVLAGFRPAPELLKNPIVLQRLIDEALKQPSFAQAVAPLAVPPEEAAAPVPPASKPPKAAALTPPSKPDNDGDSVRLKEKLKEQRTLLREREERTSVLEAALSAAERDRDTARREAVTAQTARKTAEAETERQRRQRDRDARRHHEETLAAAAAAAPAPAAKARSPLVTATTVAAAAVVVSPWEQALRRLLARGRYGTVAEVCQEALSDGETAPTVGALSRGRIHAVYAAALYGQHQTTGTAAGTTTTAGAGEEQDRLAIQALLDGGDATGAAECLARLLTVTTAPKPTDAALARRLFLLGEKLGQADAVKSVFARMRIGSPDAYRRLRTLVSGGGGGGAGPKVGSDLAERLAPLAAAESTVQALGPDESVALPTLPGVTARRIVAAVDAGNAEWMGQVRRGLDALRQRDGGTLTADALLEAVAALEPVAVQPLLQPGRPVVVDASNVARHEPDPLLLHRAPRVAYLRQMRDYLLRRGFFPVLLYADANLRFHVDNRPAYDEMVRRQMVIETPPGVAADETLIREARALFAPLVTNDRLADWGDAAFTIERRGFGILPSGVTLLPF